MKIFEIKSSKKQIFIITIVLGVLFFGVTTVDICTLKTMHLIQNLLFGKGMRIEINNISFNAQDDWVIEVIFDIERESILTYGFIPDWLIMKNKTKENLIGKLPASRKVYNIKKFNQCDEVYSIIIMDIDEKESSDYMKIINGIASGDAPRKVKGYEANLLNIRDKKSIIVVYKNGADGVRKELIIPEYKISVFFDANVDNYNIELIAKRIINGNIGL